MEAASATQFEVETSRQALGYNLPQRMGIRLWLPMLAMGLIALVAGVVLGAIRADEISSAGAADTIASLGHVQAGLTFLGLAGVLAAISFAIARILGQFRAGGGELQEATGRTVATLKMPFSAKLFLGTMMMAMMVIVVACVLHFVFAADISNTEESLALSQERFTVLEGIRRFGVAMFLVAIALGLATIIQVLRFQSMRIRELPQEQSRS